MSFRARVETVSGSIGCIHELRSLSTLFTMTNGSNCLSWFISHIPAMLVFCLNLAMKEHQLSLSGSNLPMLLEDIKCEMSFLLKGLGSFELYAP
jgi:hypothetical protein